MGRRRQLTRITSVEPRNVKALIWKTDIGHYGGLFVDVAAENFEAFKKAFPSREFPRNVKKHNVAEDLTVHGEAQFHARFPKSHGIYYTVFFADRSKGLRRLDGYL